MATWSIGIVAHAESQQAKRSTKAITRQTTIESAILQKAVTLVMG